MKIRASIKSNAFVSTFQTRLGINKSGVKCFISAIRNNSLPGTKRKQFEQKQSIRHEEPLVVDSKERLRNQKLESSIKCGFETIVSTYNSFFRTGQKNTTGQGTTLSRRDFLC